MREKDGLLTAKIEDGIRISRKTWQPYFIGFLNGHELAAAQQFLFGKTDICYGFFGGYGESERKILAIGNSHENIAESDYPVTGICFRYPPRYPLTHRDFLGAMMSLGIKRESIGDILVAEGMSVAFVRTEIKDYVITQIQKIGNTGVEVSEWNSSEGIAFVPRFEECSYTVASARLDNVVSAIIPTSREQSAMLIKQGMVCVDGAEVIRVSQTVKDGAVISVRGKGKFIVETFSGITRKGRLKMNVKKYR